MYSADFWQLLLQLKDFYNFVHLLQSNIYEQDIDLILILAYQTEFSAVFPVLENLILNPWCNVTRALNDICKFIRYYKIVL